VVLGEWVRRSLSWGGVPGKAAGVWYQRRRETGRRRVMTERTDDQRLRLVAAVIVSAVLVVTALPHARTRLAARRSSYLTEPT
jgi:hypothetical protein